MKSLLSIAKLIGNLGTNLYIGLVILELAIMNHYGEKYFTGESRANTTINTTSINLSIEEGENVKLQWTLFSLYVISSVIKLWMAVILTQLTSCGEDLEIGHCAWWIISNLFWFGIGLGCKITMWVSSSRRSTSAVIHSSAVYYQTFIPIELIELVMMLYFISAVIKIRKGLNIPEDRSHLKI